MTMTPSELARLGDASDIVEAIMREATLTLDDAQRLQAVTTLIAYLEALRLRWRAEWMTDLIEQASREQGR